ncbi:MAG TPA: hypothetical protein DDY73_13865 [Coprobacter fastidiosus]|uniref:Uncharacterized protein n=1 Tax=Coprobacter fastidiosus TaxID=1099853 RepID=A0A354M6E1_9BACT|nr:helix-turn-helix domain-containing protein [Coprobacter fastidiosus]HBJ10080.1 hypothetical protein [Coprobacter fastidiosus]
MAKKEDKKDYMKLRATAEELFVGQGMSGREIADLLNVSEVTVSNWRKGREGEKTWDDKRKELQMSPVRIKEKLLDEAKKIADGEPSTIDADKLSKIVAAIDRLDKKISIRIIADVLKECDNWLVETDPSQALLLSKYHKQFLQYRISLEV